LVSVSDVRGTILKTAGKEVLVTKARIRAGVLLSAIALFTNCGSQGPAAPSSPSSQAPTTSLLAYHVNAGAGNAETSAAYTAENATFGGEVRTTCVPNPNLGTLCADLRLRVVPATGSRVCQLLIFAPVGQTLVPGSYLAESFARQGVAGFDLNCAIAGLTCGQSAGQFTLHELKSDPSSGIVTRLHITFEQTCSAGGLATLNTSLAGKATGELWIVNGTRGFFF
jgi:hypothetical protein